MNTFKMSPDTVFHLACEVIDSIEQILSTSLLLTENEIYEQLGSDLYYSLPHIRDVFKLTTNISLTKYIIRRKYTNILLQTPIADFEKLTMHEKVCGIPKFKSKCLREFPLLIESYTLEHMQPEIDKTLLRDLLDAQIAQRVDDYFRKSFYKDIIKNRTLYKIPNNSKNIIIQTTQSYLIDLNKTYFRFKNIVFKITASYTLGHSEKEESFWSKLFGKPVCLCYDYPANANNVLQIPHFFFTGCPIKSNSFSIRLEWATKNEWGTAGLFSALHFIDSKLQDIDFINDPFILFDNQNVIFDLSFFNKN